MANELMDTAQSIAAELERLDDERNKIGRDGFSKLEQLDPELARVAKGVWNGDSVAASEWFTSKVQSLDWNTPWQCIADNKRDSVKQILHAIEHGVFA